MRRDDTGERRRDTAYLSQPVVDAIWTFFNEKWSAPPGEIRETAEPFPALDLSGDPRQIPVGARAVVERAADFLRAAGHAPIVMKREIDGFVMNRLQGALLEEAFRLVDQGYAGVEDVDVGIRQGLALRWSFMGPFETIDLNAPGGVL